ncbi:MAG: phosphoribosylformylglycinamidine synthase [Bacteroidetes bacterium CG12_big_fil_rev_8_21_14_0_65_60_17]|nr:MAG: phosphoribosylformylglycinamidine synthase [Bacteroidetes bacterium CG12_big_fil_rev_8_21_14_0_65_60_17]
MTYKAHVTVTLRPSILDPQGKATHHALSQLEFDQIQHVRIGKFIEMEIEAASEEEARRIAEEASDKLLANPVMEDFSVRVEAVQPVG